MTSRDAQALGKPGAPFMGRGHHLVTKGGRGLAAVHQ